MEVLEIEEKENGDCELHCEFTDEEIKMLLNFAVNTILADRILKLKEEKGENEQMD